MGKLHGFLFHILYGKPENKYRGNQKRNQTCRKITEQHLVPQLRIL